jgi:hypothetical protein
MNWTKFQTHDEYPRKTFETMCNQLFKKWCISDFGPRIVSLNVDNGSGGDGGVLHI